MYKKSSLRTIALVLISIFMMDKLLFTFSYASSGQEESSRVDYNITRGNGQGYEFVQRNYKFNNSSIFYMRRIDYSESTGFYYSSFYIPGNEGVVYWYDGNRVLQKKQLVEGRLPQESMLFIQTDKYHMILSQAYNYKDLGRGTKEWMKAGIHPITIKKFDGRWLVSYKFEKIKNAHGIMWGCGSHNKLIDFSNNNIEILWKAYDADIKARLCEDGYYYASPSSYNPSGDNCFWRIPSMYLINSFVKTGGSLAADIISNAMLHIASSNLNNEGYIPTLPESGWLKDLYGMGPGFFDTRFNTGAIECYVLAYKKFRINLYRDIYIRLSKYYINHIENKHYVVKSENDEGWLIEDYAHNDYPVKTHVSLNHQVAAINLMLMLYFEEKEDKYLDLAMKMLQGVKNTRKLWVMEDGNLHYAYLPDGKMGMKDYPYLTYNDLYLLQKNLEMLNGKRDDDIEYLMKEKKKWMDRKKITGYYKD